MRYVTLQPREYVWPSTSPAPLLDDERAAEFTAGLSFIDARTIDVLTQSLLTRAGVVRARVGGRFYCAAEKRVMADVRYFELDLWEIAAQIEEARREDEWLSQLAA